MSIKDVFGSDGGGAAAAWQYNPAKRYLTGMGVGTQYAVPGSYQVRFYDIEDAVWSGDNDTALAPTGSNVYGWQAVINGKYFIYNMYSGGVTVKLASYDPVTNAWTSLPNPPLPMWVHSASCGDGVTGVYVATGSPSFFHFESTTNVWTTLAQPPGFAAPVALLSRIGQFVYAFTNATVHRYDTASNTWTANVATMPNNWNYGYGACGGDGTGPIYWKGYGYNNNFRSFNGTTFTLLAAGPVTAAPGFSEQQNLFNGSMMTVHNGKVYVPASVTGSNTYSEIHVYDIASNSWDPKLDQTGQAFTKGIFLL